MFLVRADVAQIARIQRQLSPKRFKNNLSFQALENQMLADTVGL